jgi:hypothetical protein
MDDPFPKEQQPTTAKRRLSYFLLVYMLGVISVTGYYAYRTTEKSLGLSDIVMSTIVIFIFTIPSLPWGTVLALDWLVQKQFASAAHLIIFGEGDIAPAPANVFVGLLIVLSYLLTIIIPIMGGATRNQRTFYILFAVFISLLILNIGGCAGIVSMF